MIKNNFDLLGETILLICNKSLTEGIFPNSMKIAKVTPIYKDGEKNLINNYRPISVLNSMSKIIEKVVACQLCYYLSENDILCSRQFGFRPGVSTETAVNSLLKDIYDSFGKNESVICVLLDLRKAFDTVNRDFLSRKLHFYGTRNVALAWFNSFFSDRKQFVYLNGAKSSLLNIDFGVLQGSILGPIMFIVYINDIVKSSNLVNFTIYADDTTLTYATNNFVEDIPVLNDELRKVSCW